MDTLLLVLGLAGACAIVMSVWVSSSNTKSYSAKIVDPVAFLEDHEPRIDNDRRRGAVVNFPLQVNGTLIHQDRRSGLDRRLTAA